MPKKIAIFPIDYVTVSLARCAYMEGYEPLALLAPALCVLEGCDIAKLDGGKNTNIRLYTDYENKILESDMVYFVNCQEAKKLLLQLLDYAKENNKKIVMSHDMDERSYMEETYSQEYIKDLKSEKQQKLFQLDIPIISIFTIGKNCGQLQTEILARKYFTSKGYNVMQIGSHDFFSLFGCLCIPDEMFDSTIDPLNKTLIFNRFVYNQAAIKKPDIILLGVPNSIMKYNNNNNLNGLGFLPVIIQSAIRSDIGIVNMYYGNYTTEFLEEIEQFCKYKLNVCAKYFGIANTSVSKNVDNPTELEYLYLNSDFVKNNISDNEKYTMFPVYDEETVYLALKKIEKEMQENPEQI